MGDEAGLAATCRTLKEHRQAIDIGSGENFAFIALGQVEEGVSPSFSFKVPCMFFTPRNPAAGVGQARSLHGAAP